MMIVIQTMVLHEFGTKSSVHRTYQWWVENGVFERVRAKLTAFADPAGAVDWQWQSTDGAMGKTRSKGARSVRTPRSRQERRETQHLG